MIIQKVKIMAISGRKEAARTRKETTGSFWLPAKFYFLVCVLV